MTKKIKLRTECIYEIEVEDNYNYDEDDGEEARAILDEKLAMNNQLPSNEFWESIEEVKE